MRINESRLRRIVSESIRDVLNEVRYLGDSPDPVKSGDKIRVYHACSLDTARTIMTSGTSGREYHGRRFSYEAWMNPLGIFVTTDFDTAARFGEYVLEFTASYDDLDTPVWKDSDSYFGYGSNPQPFTSREERDKQREKYRSDAMSAGEPVTSSDRPEVANSLFNDSERQALFMGDLTPNMVKRVWVRGENGIYIPMSARQFVRKFTLPRQEPDGMQKIFRPTDNVRTVDDLVRALANSSGYFNGDLELSRQTLELAGLLNENPPSESAKVMSQIMWPRQIIQLYGREWFDSHFNRLGQ